MRYYLVNHITKEILKVYGRLPALVEYAPLKLRQSVSVPGPISYFEKVEGQEPPIREEVIPGKIVKDKNGKDVVIREPVTRVIPLPGRPTPGKMVETHLSILPETVVDPQPPDSVRTDVALTVEPDRVVKTINYRPMNQEETTNQVRKAALAAWQEDALMNSTLPECVAYQQEIQLQAGSTSIR